MKFWDEEEIAETASRAKPWFDKLTTLSDGEGGAKVTGRGPSSRANARDLKRISPVGRNDQDSFFACLAQPNNLRLISLRLSLGAMEVL